MRDALPLIVVAACASGCAVLRPITASNDDLADYRAFRVAAHEGVRLAAAQRYVENHPRGAWAEEVRVAFAEEEPVYFERASETRAKTSEYLASLPRGPHATAAIALLTAFDTHVEDLETDRMLKNARRMEASLEHASLQRRALGETILGDVAALVDPDVFGATADQVPAAMRRALGGLAPATWGHPAPVREDDFFYVIPTHLVRESRVATLELALVFERGLVAQGMLSGTDLFVHWDEADEVKPRDPTESRDRALAAGHAADLLAGALEARLPAARCRVASSAPREILVRRCDGWSVVVTIGGGPGDVDAIIVSGPPR